MGAAADGDPARSIMPNAGLSQRLEGRFVYAASAEYFGTVTPRLLAAGARIVGGCCGTTPEHIAAMRAALDALARRPAAAVARPRRPPTTPIPTRPPARRRPDVVDRRLRRAADDAPPPTRLAELLDAGRFVVSVEIDPPRSIRIERTIEAARLLRDAGVDIVNVSDSAMARVRMSALSVAFGIQHDLDLECLVHCTTRDRNLMALESELLGAHALGVRNIIALTGDPPRIGDYPTGHRRLGHRFDRADRDPDAAQPRRGPDRPARSASGPGSPSPARSIRPRPTRRPNGTASSASSRPARTW